MANKITIDDLAAMMKEGFDEMQGKFASKEDLNHFATKEDLKQFATKEDLKQFATKEDLKQFATKEDLKQFATVEYVDAKFEQVISQSDYQTKLLIEVRDELAASYGSRRRQQDEIDNVRLEGINNRTKISDHESRIKKLENAKN